MLSVNHLVASGTVMKSMVKADSKNQGSDHTFLCEIL